MRRRIVFGIVLNLFLLATTRWNVADAFTSVQTVTVTAAVTVGAGTNLSIQATALPSTALFGKNAIMPVQVINNSGPINPNGLSVDIVYQLLDPNGTLVGPPVSVPISFTQNPTNPNALMGSAIIPVSELQAIGHGGQLTYLFVARQGAVGTLRNLGGQAPAPSNIASAPDLRVFTPFATTISDQFCQPVSPAGARVSAPDLSVLDGETAVSLSPGAVPGPGTLCIKSEDTTGWPSGPGGAKAATVYTISLQDTSLASPAELVLSYPSDTAGKVLGLGADPGSLGIYWLDQTNGAIQNGEWRALSRASLDSTLHTLTGMTGHFSTFALFAAGAIGSASLRPAERIITPNGDGINDTASFLGLVAGDVVKIFDMRGRRVREISAPSPSCGGSFCWDGTDDSGKIVESGVYLYQFTSQGDRVSGVIAVAK